MTLSPNRIAHCSSVITNDFGPKKTRNASNQFQVISTGVDSRLFVSVVHFSIFQEHQKQNAHRRLCVTQILQNYYMRQVHLVARYASYVFIYVRTLRQRGDYFSIAVVLWIWVTILSTQRNSYVCRTKLGRGFGVKLAFIVICIALDWNFCRNWFYLFFLHTVFCLQRLEDMNFWSRSWFEFDLLGLGDSL